MHSRYNAVKHLTQCHLCNVLNSVNDWKCVEKYESVPGHLWLLTHSITCTVCIVSISSSLDEWAKNRCDFCIITLYTYPHTHKCCSALDRIFCAFGVFFFVSVILPWCAIPFYFWFVLSRWTGCILCKCIFLSVSTLKMVAVWKHLCCWWCDHKMAT